MIAEITVVCDVLGAATALVSIGIFTLIAFHKL